MSNIKNNEMTVKEFINKYNALDNDEAKKNYVKLNISSKYVPYENKITICEKIIESSHYIKTLNDSIESKKLHINSPCKHMLYCLNIVNNYTTIKVDFKNSLEEYNLLNKLGLIKLIKEAVSEEELEEFDMILDMMEKDFIANEYETKAFISGQVERFAELFGTFIAPALEQLGTALENMDENTVNSLMTKIKKVAGKLL